MKTLSKPLWLLLVAGTLIFGSCKKEPAQIDPITPTPSPGNTEHFGKKLVNSSVGGIIVDESDNPVSNATIAIGSTTVKTDANGVFLLKDVTLNEKRTYLIVNKSGFFQGSKSFYPIEDEVSYVKIQLLSSSSVGSFSSSTGGVITHSGVQLDFPTNAIKLESGGAYSGNVNVAMKFLDPTSDKIINQMPGDLMAINSSNELKILETYGMVAIELTSPTGQKLNLADGKQAELTVPLSGAYLSDAPSTIPLWYFNENEGIWKEEGSATKVGNAYVGKVSHFSFWNCDNPNPSTSINGSLQCGGSPFVGYVTITNSSGRVLGGKYTNSSGLFNGFIPMNTTLTIKVYTSSSCYSSTPLYSSTIGPFSGPATLSPINVCSSASSQSGVLTVNLKDCGGAQVTNGVLEVNVNGHKNYYFPNSSGTVSNPIFYCSASSFDITGYDFANSKQSAVITINSSATMNYGNLTICNAIDEYINYTLDGNSFSIYNVSPSYIFSYNDTTPTSTLIFANKKGSIEEFYVRIIGTGVGTFTMIPQDSVVVNQIATSPSSCSLTSTFTTYGTTPGTYKIGTFSGTFIDNSSVTHNLSGNFRIKN